MSTNPQVLVNSTSEGIRRVRQGGYAYLLESTTSEYVRQRDCSLMQIGDLLDSKGYGFGLQLNSRWTDSISSAILKLQEEGKVAQLYTKWWTQIDAINCEAVAKSENTDTSMQFSSLAGIFVLLASGLAVACIVCIIENIWKSVKNPKVRFSKPFICFNKN